MRKDIYMEVKMQKAEGIKINYSAVGKKLGCDRRTVKRYENNIPIRESRNQKSKLAEYKNIIRDKVENYGSTAKAVFDFIKKRGYTGQYGIVKKYIKEAKIKGTKKVTVRFETIPGEQAQVDWKEKLTLTNKYKKKFKINIFLYLMGSSRWKYIGLSIDTKQNSLFEQLTKAFKKAGGIPQEILFDNMKTVVDRTKISSEGLKINSKMSQFAKDYNFKVRACMPYRPQTKGKVEVVAKVTQRLAPYNEEFETLEDLEKIVAELNHDLNHEICQATQQKPIDLLEKEKPFLAMLPSSTIIEYYVNRQIKRKVSTESMIQYKSRKFSVPPAYLGKEVEIVLNSDDDMEIYYQQDKIRTHRIGNKPYNYNLSDLEDILKSDAYKYQSDDFVENQAKQHLAKLELIYGGF